MHNKVYPREYFEVFPNSYISEYYWATATNFLQLFPGSFIER